MRFNSVQTQGDPEIKYLLTQLEHHSGQIDAARRTLAKARAQLAAPPVDAFSHRQAQAQIDAAERAIASNQQPIDNIAANLKARGVDLTSEQARHVSPPVEVKPSTVKKGKAS